MKIKKVLLLGLMSVGMLYCNSTSKDENQKEERISQRFIATDGTNAMVFFGKKEGKKYVEIQNNGKTIRVHQQATDDSLQYTENGIIVTNKGDSLTIEQNDAIIELRRPKNHD
ncbi:hypothetical protein [Bergeyella zoohelcum]|uniref:hypothetical protein n=1 Tax=Bergeyella zoohelcum TaxID=1015 RepID=UPI002A91D13F|nr:hypothetical protein [Bergeyella zoohelcum]MDY6026324.1 hypothetical protein [Bergeyella zoohelcum]